MRDTTADYFEAERSEIDYLDSPNEYMDMAIRERDRRDEKRAANARRVARLRLRLYAIGQSALSLVVLGHHTASHR